MIQEKFREAVRKYRLISPGEKILVGVSGGPDSLALLYLLRGLRKELRIKLHIAHLDHMLRPDSLRDREFVEALAKKLNIPFSGAAINVGKLAKKGSLEEAARNQRLNFLFAAAKAAKADKIALGHNLDDQAETVLMRVIRGAGLYGLSGILPKRNFRGRIVIRPLLEIRRGEIESFLRRKKIRPRIDASNRQEIYLRNKIRRKLLPDLERQYNPNIRQVLANLAQAAGCDYDYLERAAGRAENRLKNRLVLGKLRKMHPAIRRLIFRRAIAAVKGDLRRLTFQHIKEVEDLLLQRPANSIVDLPAGVSVRKRKQLIFYCRRHPKIRNR
ncbi:MAG: tRNA lysidine(34) synthetase TilS [Candidatus Omnitrophota bacterium]|nr:tRNA lysidine(34) synthetase TilS [Candidatus Omnitrophota bacterium]